MVVEAELRRKRFFTNTYRKLVLFFHKLSNISRHLRKFTGECNLGILYSSSLLMVEATCGGTGVLEGTEGHARGCTGGTRGHALGGRETVDEGTLGHARVPSGRAETCDADLGPLLGGTSEGAQRDFGRVRVRCR